MDTRTNLTSQDSVQTYRYLRIGIILAVIFLGSSILIEHGNAPEGCWQTSISAYYYTPVRAVFVGTLIAVGLALLVIKGRGLGEDMCLNIAGMLAPVVAIVPTTDVGICWSVEPGPRPIEVEGSLARWLVTNVDNNFHALLYAGVVALGVAILIVVLMKLGIAGRPEDVERGTIASLVVTAGILILGWILIDKWSGFFSLDETRIGPLRFTGVHGPSAILMFLFLIGAVASRAVANISRWKKSWYFWLYSVVGLLMLFGGIVIAKMRIGGDHTVGRLEAYEIFGSLCIGSSRRGNSGTKERIPDQNQARCKSPSWVAFVLFLRPRIASTDPPCPGSWADPRQPFLLDATVVR